MAGGSPPHQTSFSRLQQRLGVVYPEPGLIADFPVFYYIFDVLFTGDRDIRVRPQRERKETLHDLLDFTGPLRYTEHRAGRGEEFYRQACRDGWEGLIAKRADAPYSGGRTRDWLKFKCVSVQELVIGGYTDPRGTRVGLGALLVGYYDADGRLAYAGKVGTGFTQATLRSLRAALSELERDGSPFASGKPPRAGVHWSRRSPSPSGPPTPCCASPGSRGCATTRTPPRSSARPRRRPGAAGPALAFEDAIGGSAACRAGNGHPH